MSQALVPQCSQRQYGGTDNQQRSRVLLSTSRCTICSMKSVNLSQPDGCLLVGGGRYPFGWPKLSRQFKKAKVPPTT